MDAAAALHGAPEGPLYEDASSEATSSEAALKVKGGYGWVVTHEAAGEPGCLESYLYLCAKADKRHFPPPPAVAPPLLRQVTWRERPANAA